MRPTLVWKSASVHCFPDDIGNGSAPMEHELKAAFERLSSLVLSSVGFDLAESGWSVSIEARKDGGVLDMKKRRWMCEPKRDVVELKFHVLKRRQDLPRTYRCCDLCS